MAALTTNQYKMQPVQGDLDLLTQSSVISCQVDAAQATPLVAGQAVKLAATAGGAPRVLAAAANDSIFGFVVRNLKDVNFPAYARVEIAQAGSTMWMTANAAITRGTSVELFTSTNRVITAAGANTIVGYALDAAVNSGDQFRVHITANQITAGDQALKTITVTALLAEINAGKTLIPASGTKKITVVDFIEQVSGNFATGTAVLLQSSNATPVVVATTAEAGLTTGAVLGRTSSNVTLGAGYGVALGAGDGLVVANSGSAQTGGTSITYTITYKQA
jgi:hypothetical protein